MFTRSSTRSSSQSSTCEKMMQQDKKNALSSSLHMTFALWFEKTKNSRLKYVRLREILQLTKSFAVDMSTEEKNDIMMNLFASDVKKMNLIQFLLLKLNTLKRQFRRHISLLKLMRQIIKMKIEKQFSRAIKDKNETHEARDKIERICWMYWYESTNLIKIILFATFLRSKMHFDMTKYVKNDDVIELWHFAMWNFSIKTTSSDVYYIRRDELIIFENILRIKSFSIIERTFHCERIVFIDRDNKENVDIIEKIIVIVQVIANVNHSWLKKYDLTLQNIQKLFIIEDLILKMKLENLNRRLFIYLDREYIEKDDEFEEKYTNNRHYIRKILTKRNLKVRSLRHLHLTRDELKVQYFDREHFAKVFNKSYISLSYLLFIDDFEIHKNIYRALKIFYLISVCLSYVERRKMTNVFTLTLSFHDANVQDVMKVFSKSIRQLDRDVELVVNKERKIVCAFTMIFFEDMSQQANNANFFHHNVNLSCRTCLCSKSKRSNFQYDIVVNDKYHWEIIRQREYAQQLILRRNRKDFIQKTRIKIESSLVARLASAFDLILDRFYDASHFEWREIDKILQSFLLTTILNKNENLFYLKAFQSFRFFSKWFRIQSSISYIWSWSLFEFERASFLISLILRKYVTSIWFCQSFILTAKRVLNVETIASRAIIKTFEMIAHANTLMSNQRYTYSSKIHQIVL